ncbi:unnamed protein product [Dicrocoelium dendriticum]|nr:unnamed protein product [Dicrocoelium dendriticum]
MKRNAKRQIVVKSSQMGPVTHIPAFDSLDEALRFLYQLFPSASFRPSVRPIILKSQLYAVIENRTSVDIQLGELHNSGRLRMLKVEDETDDSLGIMTAEDYYLAFQDAGVSDSHPTVINRFCNLVLSEHHGLSINKALLLQHFTDDEITILVHSGALTIRSTNLWWISSPQLGRFLRVYKIGQKSLLTLLRRQRFKELLLPAIFSRGIGKAASLGSLYHILAHVGNATCISIPTSSGSLIRLRT